VPIPKTLSAPSDLTFAHLNGFAVSYEDSVRYAVWLMFRADDVNRHDYSYDDNDESKGVRIYQDEAEGDPEEGRIDLPQMVIGTATSRTTWRDATGSAGHKSITIAIARLEAVSTARLDSDIAVPPLTVEARLARWEEILRRGNLVTEDQVLYPERHLLIDPYYSPRNPDGTFDQASLVVLSTKPPKVVPSGRRKFPNRRVRSEAEAWSLHPVEGFAVAYGLFATWEIEVADRTRLHGG
jgi:hypothetical protein